MNYVDKLFIENIIKNKTKIILMSYFAEKLTDLVSDQINLSKDRIDTLSDLQASLTGALALVILALKAEGIDYPPEKVCLDLKRVMKNFLANKL